MSIKVFAVSVELDIQAVTCPGVNLCPNGNIILKVFMFETANRTFAIEPVFPLLYHQKMFFHKEFNSGHNLTDLQYLLNKEILFAELIQRSGCKGVVLATFETTLFELLYPSPCVKKGLVAGVDVNLLMEPTRCFPGILAPKIELSTKTTINEMKTSYQPLKRDPGVINPKMLISKNNSQIEKEKPCKTRKLRSGKLDKHRAVCDCAPSSKFPKPSYCPTNETLKQSPSEKQSVWASKSGKIYSSPCSCSNLLKDDGKPHRNKQRKQRSDPSKKCPENKNHIHNTCTCSVCRAYQICFGKRFC